MKFSRKIKLIVLGKHADGGTGTFIFQLNKLKERSQKDIDTKILLLEKPQFRFVSQENIVFFSQKNLLPYVYLLTPKAILNLAKEFFWVKKNIEKYNPDVVLSVDNHCNVLSGILFLLFFRRRSKLILSIHNNISAVTFAKLPFFGQIFLRLICHYLFQTSDRIVCVSQGVANDTKKFFSLSKDPDVIHYGVNLRKIKSMSRKKIEPQDISKFNKKGKKIIAVGRLAPQKDFETLIKSFAGILKKVKNNTLYIIGDGPELNKLLKLVGDLKIKRKVYFLGWKQNVYSYIQKSDLFVLSSYYEGFPYILLETAAVGKPIIATDTPFGPHEFLEGGKYGTIVPMGNKVSMSDAIIELENDRKRYKQMKELLGQRIKEFTDEKMNRKYYELIKSLVLS
jgi:glycosyltransferase involved in cell wall biosynthesis